MKKALLFGLPFLIISCSGSRTFIDSKFSEWERINPPSQEDIVYQVFLLGDAGAPNLDGDPTLELWSNFLEKADEQSAAIFLGDNIYNYGLPDSSDPRRGFYEQRINAQLNTVENYKGRVVFVPGNHDWNDGLDGGLEAVNRQEQYIEEYLDRGNTFLPDNGFPGPMEIKLMDKDDDPRLQDDIRFVALDTHWWLHDFDKPYGNNGDFEVTDAGDVISELQDIIRDRKNDYLIIGAHHPLVTNDTHGGFFPLKTHLSPPIFGSLYALYRKAFGYKQDLTHHRYGEMAKAIRDTFNEKEEIIYVAGHAHTLQYHKKTYANRYFSHFIVSGSGSKEGYAARGRGADFTHGGNGFATLQFYADGSVWMEAWEPTEFGGEGNLLYRTKIQDANSNPLNEEFEDIEDLDYSNEQITTAPKASYDRGGRIYRALVGENRREMWSIESEFPVFDITEVEEGLIPVRAGGRGQSNTLHLNGVGDKEFVLRSVDKQAGKVWSEELRQSVALDVAQDQFSMLNPYAPLLVPPLAEAIGVFYMEPKYYIVPDDPKLGTYGDLMAGKLALFERKPDNDMSDVSSVNNADEVIGHLDFIREIDGDIDHRVDQELMARSRLFDMLIGDWDRHEDQWRWAAIEPEDKQGKIYQPIPRDRDVAFMRLNGLIPTLLKLGPFMQYQNFEGDYGNLKGLNYNSLGLTRRFTNQLTTEEWVSIAEDIQQHITDEVVNESVSAYPDPVETEFRDETAQILKARRDQLVEVTKEYVSLLNTVVTIPASHKREKVFIDFLSRDTVQVRVHKLSGSGELREKYFDRTFFRSETKEIRVYGMGDDDVFELSGDSKSKIKVRIIGGTGNDVLIDESPTTKRKVILYDTQTGNSYDQENRVRFELKESPQINAFDYESDYMWNSTLAGFYFNFNTDDGLFIGGGPRFTRNSFRKQPSQKHYIRANYAPLTGAANVRYTGDWYKFSGDWHGNLEGTVFLPQSFQNFFGLGNETTRDERLTSNFYRARFSRFEFTGDAVLELNEVLEYQIGTGVQYTRIEDVRDENNVLNTPEIGVNPNIFSDQLYASLTNGFRLNDISNQMNPKYGFGLDLLSQGNLGLNEFSDSHLNLSVEAKYYFSTLGNRQFTYAGRVGGNHIVGQFPFFKSNSIGGVSNLRGYRNNRFSGRSTFYTNQEVRFELFNFYNYILGGKGGLLSFYDVGRVWTGGENSSVWHQGYGGGVWFNFFDIFVLSANMGFSEEDVSFEIKSGFFF